MSDQSAPVPPAPGSTPGGPGPGYPAAPPARQLEEFFAANQAGFTEEALSAAARKAGYADADIETGLSRARARDVPSATQERARTLITRAYVVVFVVLTGAMAMNGRGSAVGIPVLLVTMLLGLGLSRLLVRNAAASAGLVAVLAVPVIFLVVIAGACVATGLPFGGVVL